VSWIKTKLEQLAEWLYALKRIWFIFGFPVGTFFITTISISPFYYLTDICFKISVCSKEDAGHLLLSFFLSIWLIVMTLSAVYIFTFGSHILRYVILRNRVEDLKTSGLVNKTKRNISLIGLSLHPFANQDWTGIIEEKLKEGVNVKLLITDPKTEFAKNRHSSLHNQEDNLCDDIEKAINIFTDFKESISRKHGDISDNFEVRLYKNNASMSTFIFDDEIRLGLIIEKGTGLDAPEIRIRNRGKQVEIFKKIQEHFDNVWSEAEKVSSMEDDRG